MQPPSFHPARPPRPRTSYELRLPNSKQALSRLKHIHPTATDPVRREHDPRGPTKSSCWGGETCEACGRYYFLDTRTATVYVTNNLLLLTRFVKGYGVRSPALLLGIWLHSFNMSV
jgi:hypothetical protein